MDVTYISFYLRAGRIHVFVDALRAIGSPDRICFMIDDDGKHLMIIPYNKRDFKSHKVPKKVYEGQSSLEISSMKFCKLISGMKNWDNSHSYRIPGEIKKTINAAVFNLEEAVAIQ